MTNNPRNKLKGQTEMVDNPRSKLLYTESESMTRFNNQNSILMSTSTTGINKDDYYIMLMHETRIFYFKKILNENEDNEISDPEQIYDDLTQVFLHLLTTTKYRILNAFYLLFRIIDNTMLVALILALLFHIPMASFLDTFLEHYEIFVVLAVEGFYDLMEYTVKIWILNRVSIFIGLSLFVGYYIAFDITNVWDDDLVKVLYFIRLGSFLLEEFVDFCIDKEIAYDLHKQELTEMPCIFTNKQQHHRDISLPKHYKYTNSVCVWTWKNTFKINNNNNGNDDDLNVCCNCQLHRVFLYAMLCISFIFGIILIFYVFIMIVLLSVLSLLCALLCHKCKCKCRNTIWHEFWKEHSV